MGRALSVLYGIACYAVFFVSFLYAIGCLGNLVVPKAIDSGVESGMAESVIVNLVLLSTFMINHFDLFGLRQVWLYCRDQEYRHLPFRSTSLYRYLRHPIMPAFIIAFWATPQMTTGHLLFAAATTVYILIGIQFEEHDLVQFLGKDYEDYRRRVPMLIPFTGKRSGQAATVRH